jgi:hypothetical protein
MDENWKQRRGGEDPQSTPNQFPFIPTNEFAQGPAVQITIRLAIVSQNMDPGSALNRHRHRTAKSSQSGRAQVRRNQ